MCRTTHHPQSGVYETVFDNGLKLLTMERPRLPIVTVMIWYRIGSSHSTPGKTGIAHLIEHLMFKGTSRMKRGEIDVVTQESGGTNNAFTGADYTCYFFNFPANSWETALEIEADRMVNCRWDPAEFANEKNVVLSELASSQDSPLELLTQEAETLCYQRHPYRYPILGWREELERLTLEEVSAFYRSYYAPNNATVVIVGDVEGKKAIAKTRKMFGGIPSGPAIPEVDISEPKPLGQKRLVSLQDVKVPRFAFLFPACAGGTFDDCVLDLIDIVLSCGRSSRFVSRLVLEEALVQSIGSYNNARKHQGIFWIHGELLPKTDMETLERAVSQELTKLSRWPLGKYELAKAKNIYLASSIFEEESNYDMANKIGRLEMICGQRRLTEIPEIVRGIQSKDIQRVSAQYLDMQVGTLVWSLPKNGSYPAKRARRHAREKKSGRKSPLRGKGGRRDLSWNYGKQSTSIIHEGRLAVEEFVLNNGLILLVLKNSTSPCASVELYAKRIFDPAGKEGTGYLVGQLLQEGTARHGARQFADIIDFLGADFNPNSGGVSVKLLQRDLDLTLDLIAEIVTCPLFEKKALQREQQKLMARLLSREDNPHYRGNLALHSLVYGDHPYGRPFAGTPASVPRITRKDLLRYFKSRFLPNRSVLVVAGDVDPAQVYRRAQKVFRHWKPRPQAPEVLPEVAPPAGPVTKYIPMDKQQVVVYWGHLGITRADPDYYKLRILDQILGEGVGFTDRLSQKLRDDLGLCYTIEASTTTHAGELPGLVVAFFSTSPNHYRQALSTLAEEIRKLQEEPVPEQELSRVKKYMADSVFFNLEENDALVALLLKIHNFQLGFDYIRKFLAAVDEITPEDIRQAAQKHLRPDLAATVVLGPVHG